MAACLHGTLHRAVSAASRAARPGACLKRTQVRISAARMEEFVQAELSVFARRAKRPPQPLTLLEIIRASSSLEKVAQLVHEELPVRFARRVKHIERVEGWSDIPELAKLHAMHIKSFRELRLADPREQLGFPEVINRVRQRHKRIPPLFAEAVQRIDDVLIGGPRLGESVENTEQDSPMDRQAIDDWAETFLRSRVSTELLMSHYAACIGAAERHGAHARGSSKVGILDLRCDPWEICQQAVAQVQDGLWPCLVEAENPSGNIAFCHAPRYLFYILEELLANSARATAEVAEEFGGRTPGPVRVTLCADEHQVVIRVSDQGGGMPTERAKKIWSYTFSTLREADDGGSGTEEVELQTSDRSRPWGVFAGQSPISGRGIGLPLSRLYAMYLGGSLEIVNMPGHGVDAYLFLNRIDPNELR